MHKTKTGRWQPDRPPKRDKGPEHTHQAHDQSYEAYLVHSYTHILHDLHTNCFWCMDCAICRGLVQGNPFAILGNVTLR